MEVLPARHFIECAALAQQRNFESFAYWHDEIHGLCYMYVPPGAPDSGTRRVIRSTPAAYIIGEICGSVNRHCKVT